MMPGMPDLTQIVLQAQQMQANMERAQATLAEAEVTGSAGSGLVTAVVNGAGDLLRIRIDPSVVDPADVETLEDLVIAAVHDARRSAEEMASQTMGSVAGGLDLSSMGLGGLSIPGFGGPAGELAADDDDDEEDLYEDDDDDEDDEVTEDAVIVDEAPDGNSQPGSTQPGKG